MQIAAPFKSNITNKYLLTCMGQKFQCKKPFHKSGTLSLLVKSTGPVGLPTPPGRDISPGGPWSSTRSSRRSPVLRRSEVDGSNRIGEIRFDRPSRFSYISDRKMNDIYVGQSGLCSKPQTFSVWLKTIDNIEILTYFQHDARRQGRIFFTVYYDY